MYFGFSRPLVSQSGYGKSKWEARVRNAKNADVRKDRSKREKEKRERETKEKKRIKHANQTLDSQFGVADAVNFAIDAPDWVMNAVGKYWLKLRDIASEFKFQRPKLSFAKIERCWELIKGSEVIQKCTYIVQLFITVGFLNKVDISYKGMSFLVSEPLRKKVTATNIFEEIWALLKLIASKINLVWETKDISLFFVSPEQSAYDVEYAFLKSQKTCIDLGRKAEIDDATYDRRVEECVQTTIKFLNTCKQSERSFYSSRLTILKEIQTSRALSKKEGVRMKPYGILMFGPSGVGKSAMCNALVRFILQVNKFDFSPRAVTTLNTQDKFQSEFSTYHQGVIFDDMLNCSLDRTSESPVTPIIMFLNNVTMAALNPNAEMKGKVMIDPKVVCATTNVKDLMSNQLSNEPLSINRRFEVTITQRVKPEFCKPGSTMLDPNSIRHMSGEQFPDFALFTVEEPRYRQSNTGDLHRTGKTRSIEYHPRYYKGKPLIDVDIKTLLAFLRDDSQSHFAAQKAFVEGQNSLNDMPLCACGLPEGMCDECPLTSQLGKEESQKLKEYVKEICDEIPSYEEVSNYLYALETRLMELASEAIRAMLRSRYGTPILMYFMKDKLQTMVCQTILYYLGGLYGFLLLEYFGFAIAGRGIIAITVSYILYLLWTFETIKAETAAELANVRRPSAWIKEKFTPQMRKRAILFLVGVGFWKTLSVMAHNWQKLPTAQAADPVKIVPDAKDAKAQQETEFWDTKSRERQYLIGDAGASEKSKTTTMENFVPLIGNRLLHVKQTDGTHCNALPLKSNVLLIPNHFVPKKTDMTTITRVGGHTFKNMPLDKNFVSRIPGTDLAVWYCPGAGVHKDLVDFYPKEILEDKKLDVFTIYNESGRLAKFSNMTATRGRVVTTEGGTFQGLKYSFPEDTFGGLCMAPLIGNAKGVPFIAGHHLAGKARTGAAGFVTRKQLNDAIEGLEKRPGILVSHSATPMKTQALGIEFGPLSAPHQKCVTRELNMDAKIRVHGSHNGVSRATRKSAVVTSVISGAAATIMKIPKQHGPPADMNSREHLQVDISGKVDTASKFDSELYQKAYIDYELRLDQLPKSELARLGKLDDDVVLAGLDGVTGINAMNFSTSIGFPGKGPKTAIVKKSDRFVKGITCPRDVDPMVLEEIKAMEKELLAGRSINAINKGSLKDEPTKLTKKKVRVFAACNIAMTMLVRKYFLTLAACFQRNKVITECAVGTVVQSPEWTELFEHIGKHGWDRAIAGDYASFDGRMSPQFMLGAFKLLIKLAEKSGNYDKDDLTIMRGIATEISYPTYDYFGTLVQFFGSNPSGHPLTVVINSMVNSLYMRYTYYSIARKKGWWKVPRFDKNVSLMTYGDDNIMTVAKGFDDFNHTAIAEEFAEVGITYTMADKEAKSVPFINLQNASFLKHYAVWDEELKLYRSPVESGSIAKMLHTHLKSDVLSMNQSSAEAIQNVALKYFEFGRDIYTARVSELERVAQLSGITGYVGPIMSYDERLKWYKEKFNC